jgi:hypothetical protein
VPGEGLVELAQWASQMVVAAAITDVWELVREATSVGMVYEMATSRPVSI